MSTENQSLETETNINLSHDNKIIGEESVEDINKTRLLLTLWDLGGEGETAIGVKKSELTTRVKRKKYGKKIGKYQGVYEELEKSGAIRIEVKNRAVLVFITDIGKQMLGKGLQNPDFNFEGTVIATRLANTLLRWIREMGSQENLEMEPMGISEEILYEGELS
ncbi:hypothetical protein [Hydrocoleum sp. CS-953]|uniref:hypothetical protein n=1 Tax=Hydrocoleum sp. CS-953 TaxID=1671698 RepID=UPI001AEF534A|nr:hypothetical protein [Hydrocoleum sp. CS-953]